MKTLKKIKLHNIAQENLADREMNILRGGNNCNCGCDNGGPSSKSDVFDFNKGYGYPSSCTCGCHGPSACLLYTSYVIICLKMGIVYYYLGS